MPTPHRGHSKSSGRSSNFVPGAMPISGSPFSSSYIQPHAWQKYFFISLFPFSFFRCRFDSLLIIICFGLTFIPYAPCVGILPCDRSTLLWFLACDFLAFCNPCGVYILHAMGRVGFCFVSLLCFCFLQSVWGLYFTRCGACRFLLC